MTRAREIDPQLWSDLAQRTSARVGIISDTHNLLRPEAMTALQGSDVVLHAGDIGGPEILRALAQIAPVIAVRGNNDRGPWAESVREVLRVTLAGARLFMIHDVSDLDVDPAAEEIAIVISGHSHRPSVSRRDNGRGRCLFINPGSAGPRRFALPICVARLWIDGPWHEADIVTLA